MTPKMLLLPILLPAVLSVVLLLLPKALRVVRDALAVAGAAVLLYYAFAFFTLKDLRFSVPWLGLGIDFDLRLYSFSSFILLALAGFLILITIYATARMKDAPRSREFMAYVFLTAAFANGAVLANNFVPLVFFWEGLLVTLYGLITTGGRPTSGRTAVKALLISGFCDFCMILGIGLLWTVSGTLTMSSASKPPSSCTRPSGRPAAMWTRSPTRWWTARCASNGFVRIIWTRFTATANGFNHLKHTSATKDSRRVSSKRAMYTTGAGKRGKSWPLIFRS